MENDDLSDEVVPGTQLESLDDIKRYLAENYTPTSEEQYTPTSEEQIVPPTESVSDSGTKPYRPINRPPQAIVIFNDDNSTSGEIVRLRKTPFQIGREAGDFTIPHDPAISKLHAEITRRNVDGEFRWYVRDLGSTNGLFVKVSSAWLRPQTQIMVGRTKLTFHAPEVSSAPSNANIDAVTQQWDAVNHDPQANYPTLRSSSDSEREFTFPLTNKLLTLGSNDQACDFVVTNDPFVSSSHAQMELDQNKQWVIQSHNNINGLWVKVRTVRVYDTGSFQIGEQRFSIKVD